MEIEYRDEAEIVDEKTRSDIGDIEVLNPPLEVTPARHVDAIVTERGQFPPESIVTLLRELFGDAAEKPWTEPDGTA